MARNEQLDRQWSILLRLQSSPAYKQELVQEFGVTARTIRRDLDTLSLHFPITDQRIGGEILYKLKAGYKPPGVWFTPRELSVLYFSREVLGEAIKGTSYEADLESLLEKVGRTQDNATRRASQELPQVYQSDFYSPQISTENVESLIRAAQEQRCVQMRYFTASRGKSSERIVEPFVIRLTIQGLHLIAYCQNRQEFRNFAINRIEEHSILKETFQPADRRFDLERYLEESFGGLRSDPVQTIKMIIRYPTAHWAKSLLYHPTQKITEVPGGIELKFRSGGESAIVRRAIGLGPDCQIIEPTYLRQKVLDMLHQIANNYES